MIFITQPQIWNIYYKEEEKKKLQVGLVDIDLPKVGLHMYLSLRSSKTIVMKNCYYLQITSRFYSGPHKKQTLFKQSKC